MDIEYIIVQAGGKGTRMEYLTENKPKCLVPVNNLPMIFHLFRKYPDKKFIVIGDYKYDVLDEYLKAFADVEYILVNASGKTGTCAGISDAIRYIPNEKSFMLIWSDLILPKEYDFPEEEGNYVGLSGDFPCRWKYEDNIFAEERSVEYGVAGHFIFSSKKVIKNVPKEGEFVRWLSELNIEFKTQLLCKTKEYGLISEYNKIKHEKCRPFNSMRIEGDCIIKEGIDEQGRELAVKEKEWYTSIKELGYKRIPEIYSMNPLKMELIKGKNIYEHANLDKEAKKDILKSMIANLKELHSLGSCETDYFSMKEAYLTKTLDRLSKIRDLIPFASQKEIVVNGRKCRNVYFYQKELCRAIEQLDAKEFKILHGDCTFSNMMLRENNEPVLIDPRGYFGHTKLYGDPAYDWGKLYYSLVGNYDQFNLKKFRLHIGENDVKLEIESNGFEELENDFFELLKDEVSEKQIKLIHAIIWLSLTTYAWEDYDSICGAFYNGIYYLEEVL